jgi:hypothetical protein
MNVRFIWSVLVTVAMVFAPECAQQESTPLTMEAPNQAGVLGIDLQDGFVEDTVVIRVDGREIFKQENVSTVYALGRADAVETQVPF